MLDALKVYLEARGYGGITLDMFPDASTQRDVIALFEWDHTVGSVNDGTGLHYIQIQVRRASYTAAREVCKALFKLLDSGTEETLLHLTPEVFGIARPLRGPLKLDAGTDYTTFYCELALWGPN